MGTERHSRFLKPTANLSCSMPDAIKIIQLFNNVQMYDCKTVRKRLTEGRAGCPSQLWPAARSAERARTRCPGHALQGGAIRPERIAGQRLPCTMHGKRRIGRRLTGGGSRTLAVLVSGQLEPGRETGLGFGSRGTDCLPRRWSRY